MAETDRLYRQHGTTVGGVAYDEGLRKYMLGVYNYMALGVAGTAIVALLFLTNDALRNLFLGPVRFIPFIGILAMGWVGPKMIFSSRNPATAHAAYWGYVALWGMLIGPVVAAFVGVGLGIEVAKAFFISASIFGAMSLYGYTTKKDLSGWSRFLMMAGIGLLVAIGVNIVLSFFMDVSLLSFALSGVIVLFISAVTAYETQMIKGLYAQGQGEMNQRASIFGAFALYGSFASLFINILNMLGMARD
ncbi:MAG: Bax inhibitor-1/YccA family protein [Pseudomonadota bacterium]